jgi:CRP/FNR family cyclic AMP-dependent transcriptional regulator
MAHASISSNLAFLKRVPLFYGLHESALERLATSSTRRSFGKGKVVVKEGEQSHGMFVMLSGRAKVQRADAEGKEVILAVLGPGEFFGEMSLIDEEPRSATVVTLDPCEFIAITKEAFQFLIAQNNEVCLRIMRSPVQRLREADRRIETEGYIESMPEGRLLLHERLRLLASS